MKSNKLVKVFIGSMIATFIFVFAFTFTSVFAAEGETANEEANAVKTAVEWIKTWSVDDLKGWIIGVFSFLGINALTFFGLAISLIRTKVREHKQSQFYQELIAKLDADHQKKVEDLIEKFNSKLDGVQESVNQTIESLDEKKKEEAKTNIEVLKKNLDEIKVELDK